MGVLIIAFFSNFYEGDNPVYEGVRIIDPLSDRHPILLCIVAGWVEISNTFYFFFLIDSDKNSNFEVEFGKSVL